jgi:RHS repeat-associated protein
VGIDEKPKIAGCPAQTVWKKVPHSGERTVAWPPSTVAIPAVPGPPNHYHADGNGNITYLVNSSQTIAAIYKYNPFGGTISSSGSLASANTYRFSSKQYHSNPGLYYYGYRFYDPALQRWLNRDPKACKYKSGLIGSHARCFAGCAINFGYDP